jgi:hypothetical protein
VRVAFVEVGGTALYLRVNFVQLNATVNIVIQRLSVQSDTTRLARVMG